MGEETNNLIVEPPNNYKIKTNLIKTMLNDIMYRKKQHYKKFNRNKKINTIIKVIVNGLNATSVCSIILALSPLSPIVMILALSTTTLSGIISAVFSSMDIDTEIHSHNTSNLQYNDLYRDISARLLRNGLNSADLDLLLGEINMRISLIEDSSLPIDINKPFTKDIYERTTKG